MITDDQLETIQQLDTTTSPVGKRALVKLVYGGDPTTGAVKTALQSRRLIDTDGTPTPLGRALADHLTGGCR